MLDKIETEIPEIEKLRDFKERSSWSLKKISEHIGIHHQTVFHWLSGKYKPSNLALQKLRKFLDVYAY